MNLSKRTIRRLLASPAVSARVKRVLARQLREEAGRGQIRR
jgi:hypothetical protein